MKAPLKSNSYLMRQRRVEGLQLEAEEGAADDARLFHLPDAQLGLDRHRALAGRALVICDGKKIKTFRYVRLLALNQPSKND